MARRCAVNIFGGMTPVVLIIHGCAQLARSANEETAVILQHLAEQQEFDHQSRHGTVLPARAGRSEQ